MRVLMVTRRTFDGPVALPLSVEPHMLLLACVHVPQVLGLTV